MAMGNAIALLQREDLSTGGQLEGYWTSDPIFYALARGTMARLTGRHA